MNISGGTATSLPGRIKGQSPRGERMGLQKVALLPTTMWLSCNASTIMEIDHAHIVAEL